MDLPHYRHFLLALADLHGAFLQSVDAEQLPMPTPAAATLRYI
jgi:hypothetical protein